MSFHSPILVNFKQKLIFIYQRFSYQLLLPLLSHFPFFLAENITRLRGILNAAFDLEWRSIALGQKFVKINTYKAISRINPKLSPLRVKIKTYQRFIAFAREEQDAAMFPHRNLKPVFQRSMINNFEPWENKLKLGKGLVVLTCHYDCFTMGMVLLGMKGYKVNAMSSNVYENPKVSRHIQNFYKEKYHGMERFFNGGQIIPVEDNLRFFYQALRNNEIVFILADLPATSKDNNPSIVAPFIDNNYHMAPGPFRLALKTGSYMAAFYCLKQSFGRYHVKCSDVYNPQELDNTVTQLYSFLQQPIQRYPERWIASDVLRGYVPDE